MTLKYFAQETFDRDQVTVFAKKELHRVTPAVDGPVEIHPLTADLDVGSRPGAIYR
jgi:hypothetical protein